MYSIIYIHTYQCNLMTYHNNMFVYHQKCNNQNQYNRQHNSSNRVESVALQTYTTSNDVYVQYLSQTQTTKVKNLYFNLLSTKSQNSTTDVLIGFITTKTLGTHLSEFINFRGLCQNHYHMI